MNTKNQDIYKNMLENERKSSAQYYAEHPDSLVLQFNEELRNAGFVFELKSQAFSFMPKYRNVILPIAKKYYQLAKFMKRENEQNHFLSFFHYKGCDEVIPLLLSDYYSDETSDLTRWFISDCFYSIRSSDYIDGYLQIATNPKFGVNRQMIVLLLGKLKVEKAIPILIDLLEDETVRLHAITALGDFKREAFRPYFERFQDSKQPGWRKCARAALKKLEPKEE